MKRLIFTLALTMIFGAASFAQKFAHVDTEYILSKIPAYQQAQTKLDNYSKQWQQEVEAKFNELDEMYKKYARTKSSPRRRKPRNCRRGTSATTANSPRSVRSSSSPSRTMFTTH